MRLLLRREDGQQLVLTALLMPVLLAFVGLVIDVGMAYVTDRKVQAAADAAIRAAAMSFRGDCRNTTHLANMRAIVEEYLVDNHYTADRIAYFGCPRTGSAYYGNHQYLQLALADTYTPFFVRMVWRGTFPVRAQATAGYRGLPMGADLIVLKDPVSCTGGATMTGNGNSGRVDVAGIVQVNSHCPNALDAQNMHVTSGKAVNVSGPSARGSHISPTLSVNMPPVPDPLAHLPAPGGGGSHCINRSAKPSGGKFLPGIYETTPSKKDLDGVVFDGRGDPTNHCNGVFIFREGFEGMNGNGDFEIDHGMFYIENGDFDLGGNFSITKGTPPDKADGAQYAPYHGVLIFMARDNAGTADFRGTSGLEGPTGMVYLPNGHYSARGNVTSRFSLITNTFEIKGGVTLEVQGAIDYQKPQELMDVQVE